MLTEYIKQDAHFAKPSFKKVPDKRTNAKKQTSDCLLLYYRRQRLRPNMSAAKLGQTCQRELSDDK